jgi:predicted phosphoadenosine phosphosulfate sulfurtransferase
MKILSGKNVFDAALDRIRYIFDEFPNVVAGVSGGKDSTVIFELTMRVARERGRLPLTVFWLDQEAEWTSTVSTVRDMMYNPDVKPMWLQCPIHMDNAASFVTKFLKCWDPEREADWVHSKDPISIKENTYGTDRFKELFPAIFKKEFPGQKVAVLAGVRAEESPARLMGLTQGPTYKWITWGIKLSDDQYTFYPLYDWSYSDIWHAIHSEKWPYNSIYNYQYRYGVPVNQMRVSNLHHETAVRSLFHLQEIDPALYERLAARLPGVDTAGKMGAENFYAGKLPFMFKDWCEYRDYLIEKLTANDPKWQAQLTKTSKKFDELFASEDDYKQKTASVIVQSILCNDYTGTKIDNYQTQFVGKYLQDRRRGLKWVNDETQQSDDPVSFQWYVNRLRQSGVEEDGRRVYRFQRYKYWITGSTLHREAVAGSRSAPVAGAQQAQRDAQEAVCL